MSPKARWTGLAATGLVLALAAAGWAETGTGRAGVDRLGYSWTETQATAPTEWTNVPGLEVATECGNGRSAATVSLDLVPGSDPVQVRVAMDDPIQRCPGCSDLDGLFSPMTPTLDETSSFEFVGSHAPTGVVFHAQWRLDPATPGNPSATLDGATLQVLSNQRTNGRSATC